MNPRTRQGLLLAGILVLGVVVAFQIVIIRTLRGEVGTDRAEIERLRLENDRLREIPRARQEMVEAGRWLHAFYKSDEGLKRPNGLWLGDEPDFEGIGAWILDVYLSERIAGATVEAARQRVVDSIQQTEEWRHNHPNPAKPSS
jgi:hypothetical protein